MIQFSCKNPQHPANIPRDRDMKVLEESDHHLIVACIVCRDYYGAVAAQYITRPKGWEKIRWERERRLAHGLDR
jgi:hypothetical protein